MTELMRAIDIRNGTGPATSLFINPEVPKPILKPHECLIKVHAFGLNRGDIVQREGLYPMPPGTPKTLGLEFSGVVVVVGDGKDADEKHHWKEGDRVFGLVYGGAYAEYVAVDKRMLIRKPEELTWESCGGMCESWFTALQALYLIGEYNPNTTHSILWHAGASTISICGIQLSLLASIDSPPCVFATTRQDTKAEFCVKELGAAAAVNTTAYPNSAWVARLKSLNGGGGIDLIIDFIGGPYFSPNLELAAQDGKIVNLGLMGGPVTPEGKVDVSHFVMKRVRYEGSTLRSRSIEYQIRVKELFVEKVLPRLVEGTLKNHVDRVFKWEDVGKAHELMEGNGTMGKVVCAIDC